MHALQYLYQSLYHRGVGEVRRSDQGGDELGVLLLWLVDAVSWCSVVRSSWCCWTLLRRELFRGLSGGEEGWHVVVPFNQSLAS